MMVLLTIAVIAIIIGMICYVFGINLADVLDIFD